MNRSGGHRFKRFADRMKSNQVEAFLVMFPTCSETARKLLGNCSEIALESAGCFLLIFE